MARSLFLCISLRTRAQGNVKKRTAARRTSEAEKIGSTGPVKSLQPSAFFLTGPPNRRRPPPTPSRSKAPPRPVCSPASRRRFPWPSAFPHPFRRDRRNLERPASPYAFTQQSAPRPVCSPASRRRFPWPSAFPHPFRRQAELGTAAFAFPGFAAALPVAVRLSAPLQAGQAKLGTARLGTARPPHAFTQQSAPRPVCSPASRRRFLKVF